MAKMVIFFILALAACVYTFPADENVIELAPVRVVRAANPGPFLFGHHHHDDYHHHHHHDDFHHHHHYDDHYHGYHDDHHHHHDHYGHGHGHGHGFGHGLLSLFG